MTTLDDTTAVGLRRRIQGSVLQPDDGGFVEATFLWNAMVERKPTLVVQPADDVNSTAGGTR